MSLNFELFKWVLVGTFLVQPITVRADVWTGATTHLADFGEFRDSFHDTLLRQMQRALSNYLDNNKDLPAVKRFTEEHRGLLLEHLESEVENCTQALGEYSMQILADCRAVPIGDSFQLENLSVECAQTVGFESTWDPTLAGFPIGTAKSLQVGLDFEDVKVGEEQPPVLLAREKAEVNAEMKGWISLILTFSFPIVDGKGYDLLTVTSEDKFPETAPATVVIGLIEDRIRIRVHDDSGMMVAQQGESEIEPSIGFRAMRDLFGDRREELLENDRERLIRRAIALCSEHQCVIVGKADARFEERLEVTIEDN